jgi:four helix bundle protein
MELAVSVYAATQFFPKQELYGLVSQMRRAAVSIPSNIAEGRCTDRDRAHFFAQAWGSLLELETQILIAAKLDYVSDATTTSLLDLSKKWAGCSIRSWNRSGREAKDPQHGSDN